MTDPYIRKYIQQNYDGVNPTKKMIDEAESAINESLPSNLDGCVDDELFDLVYKTFKEYLTRIRFRSFYKNTYIGLPDVSAREIDRAVRDRAVKTGRDASNLTGCSIPISRLLDEDQLDKLHESGQEIISRVQHELKCRRTDDNSLGYDYTYLDVWVGKCNYYLSQRDWSSLSSKFFSCPIKSDKSFNSNQDIDEIWNDTVETFDELNDGPISALSEYTVSNPQELYEFYGLEPSPTQQS